MLIYAPADAEAFLSRSCKRLCGCGRGNARGARTRTCQRAALRAQVWRLEDHVHAARTSPTVAHAESCRKRLHAPRLTYLAVVLDNRQGKVEVDGPRVDVVTKAGRRVMFDDIGRWINDDDWLGRSPVGSALYEECAVRLFNALINRDHALPGQKTSYVMTAHGSLRSRTSGTSSPGIL